MERRITVLKKKTLLDCAFLFFLAFGVQYLFLEGLPFFWQEDINLIETGESICWTALIQDIFNPFPALFNPFSYRPMMDFFYKLALSFSGYDPAFYQQYPCFICRLAYFAFRVINCQR